MFKHTLLITMLLLFAAGNAFAQDSDVGYEEMIEAEEMVEVEFDWFVDEDWGLTVFLPIGGTYYSPEELGIGAEDDPMSYPLIWISDDVSLPYNMVMFGALAMDTMITDEDYGFYFEEFMYNVQLDFPHHMQEVDAVDIHDRVWDRFVVADDDGAMMINYLTYVDDVFYSTSFLSGSMTEYDEALYATVEQLDILFMLDDFIPEEDMLLPWYF